MMLIITPFVYNFNSFDLPKYPYYTLPLEMCLCSQISGLILKIAYFLYYYIFEIYHVFNKDLFFTAY